MKSTAMVIGYGNDLRSDDGIGQRVVQAIESWHLSAVESLAVHQLTPELATNLADADLAIFVDASVNSDDVQVQSLVPASVNFCTAHIGDPQGLLALTQALYGHCPCAWWVTVPGINFELGDRLSARAERGIAIALVKIIHILNQGKNLWMQ